MFLLYIERMSNYDYLPANRGFDSSFGYLGSNADHWTHEATGHVDLWHDLEPAADYEQYSGIYGDVIFNQRTVDIIHDFAEKQSSQTSNESYSDSLFIYYCLHVTHGPIQAPQEFIDLYSDDMYEQRKGMNAMTSVVDDIVFNITTALKETGLWNDTILLFASDNGGMNAYSLSLINTN